MTTHWNNGIESYRFATATDLSGIAEMLADPDVGKWLWFTPAPREQFIEFFTPLIEVQERQQEAGLTPHTAVFSVEEGGNFLGQGAVLAVDGSPGGFEIGFQLRRLAWGRGVGTRLAQFLCAYAVHRCDAFRIQGSCLEENVGSRAILARLGLNLEGSRPGYRVREELRYTEVLYGAEVSQLDTAEIQSVAESVGLV